MKIIDNFVDDSIQNNILEYLTDSNFPWYFSDSNSTINPHLKSLDSMSVPIQMGHIVNIEGKSWATETTVNIISPLKMKIESTLGLNPQNIFRIKMNLLFPHYENNTFNVPHTDRDIAGAKSVIYYVNDSDGDTILFNTIKTTNDMELYPDIRVSPKKGRIINFDSDIFHTSSCPKENRFRIVINFVYH